MPRLTEEQIAAAREVDLLSFLSAKAPHELKRTGAAEYRTVTHGSLVITPRYWYWNRGGIGSASAIDFLVKVQGMVFIEAVREVLSTGLAHEPVNIPVTRRERTRPIPERPVFKLPTPAAGNDNLTRYLLSRGISQSIIERCIKDGILYESRYLCSPACVFVGRDDDGKARFANIRGIDTGIKRDVAGSDKRYSFSLKAQDATNNLLSVFESSLDALSHQTLGELYGWEQGCWRLSLAGTSPVALESFLERHGGINRVTLHMDNDEAGIAGALRIKSLIESDARFEHVRVSVKPVRGDKDYNERLARVSTRTSGDNDKTPERRDTSCKTRSTNSR
jgi:hypothetical protein